MTITALKPEVIKVNTTNILSWVWQHRQHKPAFPTTGRQAGGVVVQSQPVLEKLNP